MIYSTGRATPWLLGSLFALILIMSLSCCNSTDTPADTSKDSATAADSGGGNAAFPDNMNEAIARGKKENKVTVIELFDVECAYSVQVQTSLKNKEVRGIMKNMVHTKITPEAEGVIEEFGLMESPTFMFFKPDGTYMEPYVQGFRSPYVLAVEMNNYLAMAEGKETAPIPEDEHPDFGKG